MTPCSRATPTAAFTVSHFPETCRAALELLDAPELGRYRESSWELRATLAELAHNEPAHPWADVLIEAGRRLCALEAGAKLLLQDPSRFRLPACVEGSNHRCNLRSAEGIDHVRDWLHDA